MMLPRSTTGLLRRLFPALALAIALALVVSACGDDDDSAVTEDAEETADDPSDDGPTDTAMTEDDEAALSEAVDDIAVACGAQNRDRLRDLGGAGIRDRIRDRDPLFTAVDELTVVERVIDIDGDTATVTVTLDITVDGDNSQVERVWTYERVDGAWLLSDVPDCLFS